MLDDLDHVFRNISRRPVNDDVKTAFGRVITHCALRAEDDQKQALEDFSCYGRIVLMQDHPVKPFFYRKFSKATLALSEAFETTAA